jgi:signal peptidase I
MRIFFNKAWPVILQSALLLLCGCQRRAVVSNSMAPTIAAGEKIVIDYSAYAFAKPQRWDVVAFEYPKDTNQVWVMRVIALPGETVSFATGGVSLNNAALVMPGYLSNVTYVSLDRLGQSANTLSPYVVPAGSYFLLGDNSTGANDSRFWGAAPQINIVGKVRNK